MKTKFVRIGGKPTPPKFRSTFAQLDVRFDAGARALAKRLDAGEKVRVVITGTIDPSLGARYHDAESINFQVDVTDVKEVSL